MFARPLLPFQKFPSLTWGRPTALPLNKSNWIVRAAPPILAYGVPSYMGRTHENINTLLRTPVAGASVHQVDVPTITVGPTFAVRPVLQTHALSSPSESWNYAMGRARQELQGSPFTFAWLGAQNTLGTGLQGIIGTVDFSGLGIQANEQLAILAAGGAVANSGLQLANQQVMFVLASGFWNTNFPWNFLIRHLGPSAVGGSGDDYRERTATVAMSSSGGVASTTWVLGSQAANGQAIRVAFAYVGSGVLPMEGLRAWANDIWQVFEPDHQAIWPLLTPPPPAPSVGHPAIRRFSGFPSVRRSPIGVKGVRVA